MQGRERFQIGDYWLSKRSDRASNYWQRTWFDQKIRQTRRTSLGTEDFEKAKIRLAEWVTTHGELANESSDEVPLETILERYYEKHGSTLASAESQRLALVRWSDFFAACVVSDVTLDRQEQFVATLQQQGLSDGYIRRILTIGKAALNWALKRQEIATAPYIQLIQSPDPLERVLSIEEVSALFESIGCPHLFVYCMVAFNTLGRPEAILQLKRFQVDMKRRLIHFNPPGRRQTRKYRAVVPITNTLMPVLKAIKTANIVSFKGREIRSVRHAFRDTCKKAGLGKEVIPRTIRHTMATELRARGVPPWEVSGMLGHRARTGSQKTTEIYAKYAPDYLGLAAQAVDEYFAQVRATCVPLRSWLETLETQVDDFYGRREWDRTTDHYHVKVPKDKQKQELEASPATIRSTQKS